MSHSIETDDDGYITDRRSPNYGKHVDELAVNCAWCLREHCGACDGDSPHGDEDHIGLRCPTCAAESGYYDDDDNWVSTSVMIESSSGDHWQTKQLQWQEACDVIFRQVDEATLAHFPEHEPQNCKTCPVAPDLPPKPLRPIDRVDKQSSREFLDGSDQDYA